MTRLMSPLIGLVASLCVLPLAAMTADEATEMAMQQAEQNMNQSAGSISTLQTPIALREADITGMISVLPQLNALGVRADLAAADDPTGLTQGMQINTEAMALLKKHGFTMDHFQKSLYSVGMALMALESDIDTEEMAEAKIETERALAEMQDQLSPEQLAMLRQQLGSAMDSAMGALSQMQNQPPGNLELVKKYRTQLEAAFEAE